MPHYRVVAPTDPEFPPLRCLASIRFAPGALPEWRQKPATLSVTLTNPEKSPARIGMEGQGVTVSPLSLAIVAPGQTLPVTLTFPTAITAAPNDVTPHTLGLTWNGEALPRLAPIETVRVDPVRLAVIPRDKDLAVTIENPAAQLLAGTLAVGGKLLAVVPPSREIHTTIAVPKSPQTVGTLSLLDEVNQMVASTELPHTAPLGVPANSFRAVLHVENKGQAGIPVKPTSTKDDKAPAAVALAVPYTFEKGWRYLTVQPSAELKAPAGAVALSFWIKPDGTKNALRARIRDASGQTFQRDLGQLDGTDWRPARIDLTTSALAPGIFWGGKADGVVHPPVAIEAMILIDSSSKTEPKSGEVLIAAPTFLMNADAR
jgi:hypothetical protein